MKRKQNSKLELKKFTICKLNSLTSIYGGDLGTTLITSESVESGNNTFSDKEDDK